MIVAGDAAGLLEPWTREGISFALRSGALAGAAAARAAAAGAGELDGYVAAVDRDLVPEMHAGYRLLAAFERHPWAFHGALALPPGFAQFTRFCQGQVAFAELLRQRRLRAILAAIGPAGVGWSSSRAGSSAGRSGTRSRQTAHRRAGTVRWPRAGGNRPLWTILPACGTGDLHACRGLLRRLPRVDAVGRLRCAG